MMETKSIPLADFATETGEYFEHGRILTICGEQYKAWYYDTYIYDAIKLAARWPAAQVNYRRITHLRCWLRENIQHSHNLAFDRIRTMMGCKKFIDKLIRSEYAPVINEDDFKEQMEFQLK